ncbi:hypothetical protein Dimus_009317 [Dionaea muscipula]
MKAWSVERKSRASIKEVGYVQLTGEITSNQRWKSRHGNGFYPSTFVNGPNITASAVVVIRTYYMIGSKRRALSHRPLTPCTWLERYHRAALDDIWTMLVRAV